MKPSKIERFILLLAWLLCRSRISYPTQVNYGIFYEVRSSDMKSSDDFETGTLDSALLFELRPVLYAGLGE